MYVLALASGRPGILNTRTGAFRLRKTKDSAGIWSASGPPREKLPWAAFLSWKAGITGRLEDAWKFVVALAVKRAASGLGMLTKEP